MRKILAVAILFFGVLSVQAQEKVMNIKKKDGTSAQTRVTDLKQISFLSVDKSGQGMLVKTLGGETAAVLFETDPVVTVSSGKLVVKPRTAEVVEVEIADIAEILFGDATGGSSVGKVKDFDFVLQKGGALFRGIPKGVTPCVYSLDGRRIPAPAVQGGELRLNRETMGTGIFIVKVGTFSTKIQL